MRSAPRHRADICVVGAGFEFTSGISYYTDRLVEAFHGRYEVFGVLVRRLIPACFYPGSARVGRTDPDAVFRTKADTFDLLDWYWGPNMIRTIVLLLRRRPRIVVLQWWTGALLHTYLVLGLLCRLIRAKVVIEFHEVQDVGEAELPFAGRYVKFGAALLVKLADGAVIHSESDRAPIQQRYNFTHPLVVIPHGPYEQHGTLSRSAPEHRAGDEDFNLLYFGVIRPFKGVEDLVRAFDQLSEDEAAGLTLTIAGETWENWTLPSELIQQSSRSDRISFDNYYLSDAELAEKIARADAVVLPYHRSSASGPLHTAMSAGLPVIVSAVGGLPEAADGYAGAEFVPPRDPGAIRQAIVQVRGRGRQRFADPHSWDRSLQKFAELFTMLERDRDG